MGHKINPNIFRLGISRRWKYQIKKDYLLNINLRRFLKSLFWDYTVKLTTYNHLRASDDVKAINKNPFFKKSFVFSHVTTAFSSIHNEYVFNVYLFDSELDEKRIYDTSKKIKITGKYLLTGITHYKGYKPYKKIRKYRRNDFYEFWST